MITQTEAIALQIRPWSKTSHIVTWLTPDHGRIVTSIKGASRPKSPFLGQYDLFYTCDLQFYTREHDGVHIAKECSPLICRAPLREQWRATATAAYLADLTARALPLRQPHPEAYALLTQTLDYLSSQPVAAWVDCVIRYELHLLHYLGLLPDLSPCSTCHTPRPNWFSFSVATGRILCKHDSSPHSDESVLSLHPSIQAHFVLLRQKLISGRYPLVFETESTKKNAEILKLPLGLSRFLGIFITSHLDVPASVRRVALEMIETTPTQRIALQEIQQP
jgi:DNA repair protein RecO